MTWENVLMTKFYDILSPEAQEDLLRDGVIELVTVCVDAVPDPERPEDRHTMSLAAEISDDFCEGIPWIDEGLDRIQAITGPAGEDLSQAVQDHLLVELNQERKIFEGLKEGKIGGHPVAYLSNPVIAELLRPTLENPVIEVLVWCHAWTVAMDDDGKMIVDVDTPLYFEGLDEESRTLVNERIRQVDAVIGRMVEKGMGGIPP
jgi:hypothetical protein